MSKFVTLFITLERNYFRQRLLRFYIIIFDSPTKLFSNLYLPKFLDSKIVLSIQHYSEGKEIRRSIYPNFTNLIVLDKNPFYNNRHLTIIYIYIYIHIYIYI